jgi:hypothetical protein
VRVGQQDGRVGVAQVVQPDHRQRLFAQRLAAAGAQVSATLPDNECGRILATDMNAELLTPCPSFVVSIADVAASWRNSGDNVGEPVPVSLDVRMTAAAKHDEQFFGECLERGVQE